MPTPLFDHSPRTSRLARVGGLARWATKTEEQRKAAMAKVREGIKDKYRAEAREIMSGENLTDAQIDAMAARMWYADTVKKAALATEARLAKAAAKHDPWTTR